MRKILIVIDMQNDFIDGALGTEEAVSITPLVEDKVKNFKSGRLVFTRDSHTEEYMETQEGEYLPVPHCVVDTKGWQIADSLLPYTKDADIIDKPSFGSIELAEHVKALNDEEEIDEIILVGLCTDICVISNAMILKAMLPEVKITVDSACCAGVTPETHQNALEAMKSCQINII